MSTMWSDIYAILKGRLFTKEPARFTNLFRPDMLSVIVRTVFYAASCPPTILMRGRCRVIIKAINYFESSAAYRGSSS
jgi:hypothetical protein